MADFCNYAENAAVDAAVGAATLAATTSLTLHLHTADPGEVGTTAEVTGGSYAAQAITFSAPEAGTGSNRKVENDAAITFAGMPATTVTHFSVQDQASNVWFKGAFSSSIPVGAGGDIDIAIDGISIELSGDWTATVMDGILNAFRGNAAFNQTAETIQVTLCTADPGTGVVANEISGITRQTPTWGAASDGVKTNSGDITFPTVASATAAWAALVRLSDGQVFWSDDITDATSTDFRIKSGQMSVTVA